jgi:hypothetical protein
MQMPTPASSSHLARVSAQYLLEVASAAGVWLTNAAASGCSICTAGTSRRSVTTIRD